MFEDFHHLIMEWLRNNNRLEQIKTFYQPILSLNERNPEKKILWDRWLRLLIPKDQQSFVFRHHRLFETVISELISLSQYVGQQKVSSLVERHFSNILNSSSLYTIKSRVFEFHNQVSMWEDGSWNRQIQQDRYNAVTKLSRHAGFEDEWLTAAFLADCGYLFPCSESAYQAWQRYSGQFNSQNAWEDWLTLLFSVTEDPKQIFIIDFTLDRVFGSCRFYDMPLFCTDSSACYKCPLMAQCNHFLSEIKGNLNTSLENQIRLDDVDEIKLSQLIPYLAGNKWSNSQMQNTLLKEFLKSSQATPVNVKAGSNDEKFFFFLKGLKSLTERVLSVQPSTEDTVFNKSEIIYSELKSLVFDLKQEAFYTLILDNKYRKIYFKLITRGTLNQSLIHPREVFAPAIQLRAAAVILVHNHPSGDPRPSPQDIDITKRLAEVGNIVGINVVDHVIIGHDSYFSFIDEDLM